MIKRRNIEIYTNNKGGMMRLFIAGKYSTNKYGQNANTMETIENIRDGIQVCAYLIKLGFDVYCPWLDYQYLYFIQLSKKRLRYNSMAWLEVSDAVYVMPDSELSTGTQLEIEAARRLNIPVYYDCYQLSKVLEDRINGNDVKVDR